MMLRRERNPSDARARHVRDRTGRRDDLEHPSKRGSTSTRYFLLSPSPSVMQGVSPSTRPSRGHDTPRATVPSPIDDFPSSVARRPSNNRRDTAILTRRCRRPWCFTKKKNSQSIFTFELAVCGPPASSQNQKRWGLFPKRRAPWLGCSWRILAGDQR